MRTQTQCPNCKHYFVLKRDRQFFKTTSIATFLLALPFFLLVVNGWVIFGIGGLILFGTAFLINFFKLAFKKRFTAHCQRCNYRYYI